jgi:putative glutamine amidotransferase
MAHAEPPVIGITTYPVDSDGRFTLPAVYVSAVRRAGGVPVLLAPGQSNPEVFLARMDGAILTGGGDLGPELYGGRHHETIYGVDPGRDATEIALARLVCSRETPLLGICRGTQVLNVALGGSLIEHLPDEVGTAIPHRLPPRQPTRHKVSLAPHSRLAHVLGTTECSVASWHHQAIRGLGQGLQAVAWAPDGVIEAVEIPDLPWLLAVQWHPELTAADDPIQQRLFAWLVEAARDRRKARDATER